jgi:phosphoglycolate phosphatase
MVGDRSHDIAGAHANGVRAIGALWGYGSREELTSAAADALAASPSDLPGLIAALS